MYEGYQVCDDRILIYKNRMYIPNSPELRRISMGEIHNMTYFGHPCYHKNNKQEINTFGL
jgi:hypothetical protein